MKRLSFQPASVKPPSDNPADMSAKQEGVSNTDTSNPLVNEEGKSVKGEGETDSVKLKGTVSPEREQK